MDCASLDADLKQDVTTAELLLADLKASIESKQAKVQEVDEECRMLEAEHTESA